MLPFFVFSAFSINPVSLMSRLSALTLTTNMTLMSKSKIGLNYRNSPIFSHVPISHFPQLTIKNIRFEKQSQAISFGVCNIVMDTTEHFDCIGQIINTNNTVFSENVYQAVNSTVILKNCIFSCCGYIDIHRDSPLSFGRCNISIINTQFISCIGSEGIIFAYQSQFSLSRSNFTECSVNRVGGALYCQQSTVRMLRCLFLDNEAEETGVGYFLGCKIHFDRVDCLYNRAFMTSSAFEFLQCERVDLIRCRFYRNKCTLKFDDANNGLYSKDQGTLKFNDCSVHVYYCHFGRNTMDDDMLPQFPIYAIGATKINTIGCYFDTNFSEIALKIADENGQTPIVHHTSAFKGDSIPQKYLSIINERELYFKKIYVNCASALSQSYIIATFVVTVVMIVVAIVILSVIAGGFI